MKNALLLLLISISLCSYGQGDTWTQKTWNIDAPGRKYTASFEINGKVYFGTGYTSTGPINDFWVYDPISNTMTKLAILPGKARMSSIGFSINGKGYIGLGLDASNNQLADVYEYDPGNDTWQQIADYPKATSLATAFTIGNKAYVGTGSINYTNNVLTGDFYAYDQSSKIWTSNGSIASLPKNLIGASSFTINGKGYVVNGSDSSNTYYNELYEYDPSLNKWTSKSNFQGKPRALCMSFVINGKAYVGMGLANAKLQRDLWQYDPGTDIWTQVNDFSSSSRAASASQGANGKGYILAGSSGPGSSLNFLGEIFEYTPPTTSINEVGNNKKLLVFPQPSSNQINIQLPTNNSSTSTFTIYDLNGRVITNGRFSGNSHSISTNISEGIYNLKVANKKQSWTKTISIHK